MPSLLKATTLSEGDVGSFEWNASHNDSILTVSDSGLSIEWGPKKPQYEGMYPPAFVPATTLLQLHSGAFKWDFVIEEMAEAQIGVGFMLQWDIGPDWGMFGYLGAANSAWSYDPSSGDIVNDTQSIHGGLPKFADGRRGVVSVELNLPRDREGSGKFVVDGKDTPQIELPECAVLLPAACLLKETQKITLANFRVGLNRT